MFTTYNVYHDLVYWLSHIGNLEYCMLEEGKKTENIWTIGKKLESMKCLHHHVFGWHGLLNWFWYL